MQVNLVQRLLRRPAGSIRCNTKSSRTASVSERSLNNSREQTEGYGVPFPWKQYELPARAMRTCQGKVMLSINDHPAIRACFAGLVVHEQGIKYSVGNTRSAPKEGELIITNYARQVLGELFQHDDSR